MKKIKLIKSFTTHMHPYTNTHNSQWIKNLNVGGKTIKLSGNSSENHIYNIRVKKEF